jgi:hypothetical protein
VERSGMDTSIEERKRRMATAVVRKKKTKTAIDPVARELRRIYRAHGNRMHPPHVINAARDPDSPLHKFFLWDNTKAAEEFRLIQARQLIATVRITIPDSAVGERTIRAYHSLRSEQSGYRHMEDIVDAPDLLESLVSQFASDLERITDRYDAIRSTAKSRRVFEVIEEFVGASKQKEPATA